MGVISANQFNLGFDAPGLATKGINLGEQFRLQELQKKQTEFIEGGGLESDTAIQDAGRISIGFQKQVAEQLGLLDKRTGQIDQKRLNDAANFSFKIQDLPIEQQNIAINERINTLESEGRDATQTHELLQTPLDQRGAALNAVQLAALPNEKRLSLLKGVQPGTSEREFNSLISGFSPEDQLVAKRIKAGLDPRATGSAIQTITEKGTVKDIAETEKTIETAKAEGKGEGGLASEEQKLNLKANTARIKELSDNKNSRAASTKKASKFLRALESGSAHSGASRRALDFVPGVFTSQAQFDEEFNSFSEVAARQQLKAAGELRPTDADVEGMKRAMFGIGRDEDTNIQLLQDFINDQQKQDNELDDLISSKRAGTLRDFTIGPIDQETTQQNELSPEEQAELEALKAEFGVE